MAENDEQKSHVAMFPWLALGHMIPYLELAKLIAQRGHRISYITTPRNIDRLPKLPSNLSPLITFVKIPLPHSENLPKDAECTSDLPLESVCYLKKAYDLLQEPLTQFLQSSPPDWILFDFAPYWLPAIARKLNIANAFFSIFTAATVNFACSPRGVEDYRAVSEDYTVTPNWIPFPSTVAFRYFEALKLFAGLTGSESNVSDIYRFVEVGRQCDLIVVRTCVEFEPEWLDILGKFQHKPAMPVGVLAPTINDNESDDGGSWQSIKDWLDKREKGSVVYIAFGSEAKPSQEELSEIALGLELSGLPFFWVLRKRRGLADTELIELPDGFEQRTKGRGVVFTDWAPQLRILAHDSVGGFLTHGGWSSVIEALQFARPLLLLTYLADQGLNAKLLEEKMIGYVIPRNEQDGSFTRNSVAASLRLVVVEDEGKIYRAKAQEMRGLFGDRARQDGYVDNLLGFLNNNKKIK
uniref:UDP-glucosyltransferase n=1 Tax=Rhizophora mucronata TaxID=61149 RepID=A0A2P2P111_RHIMU